jgi:hypothetical protein
VTAWKRKRRSGTKNRRVGKALLRRAHRTHASLLMVGTLRFAHPTPLRGGRSITPRGGDGVHAVVTEHMRREAGRAKDF